MNRLAKQDEQVFNAIQLELGRQRSKIELNCFGELRK